MIRIVWCVVVGGLIGVWGAPRLAWADESVPSVVTLAQQQIGIPYHWGGSTPETGMDCSGLVQFVFAQAGIALPRTAAEQAVAGQRVAVTEVRPGDLVAFAFPRTATISHIGIYAGNGWMIHAPAPGTSVRADVLWSDAWWPHAVHGTRIIGGNAPRAGLPIFAPPSLSRDRYQQAVCTPRHGRIPPPCSEAGAMYDLLVDWGADPGVHLGFALLETELGTTGPGRMPQRNLHNLECNPWDGGACTGPHHGRFQAYPSYLHATYAWVALLRTGSAYAPAGRRTVEQVIPIYAPAFENDVPGYIDGVRRIHAQWSEPSVTRHVSAPTPSPSPVPTVRPVPTPTPTSTPVPLAPIQPCGVGTLRTATRRYTAPSRRGVALGTLPSGVRVTWLCREGRRVTDGAWIMIAAPSDAVYTWIPGETP